MKNLFALFGKNWLVSLLGLAAGAVLIWFAGPLFAFAGWEPFASVLGRILGIAALVLGWGLNRIRIHFLAKRANARLLEAAAAPDPISEEREAVRRRFEEAVEVLKTAKVQTPEGRQYIRERPWYIIIGPSGCGKTTALANSGLHFPLEKAFGRGRIEGVSGTRDCYWWWTNEAVIIDTAGRWTTQDHQAEKDRAGWLGFLELLKKHRRRQPINGVLVAISVKDLLEYSDEQRAADAQAVQRRIQELHRHLRMRFPIYFLVMKADLLAGFMEFFADLGDEGRSQVWGVTFEEGGRLDVAAALTRFGQEFDGLIENLNARLIGRLEAESDDRNRALVYAFPEQVTNVKARLQQFLGDVFLPSGYGDEPVVLRGVYLTSGTQVGTPIDGVMSAMAKAFNLDASVLQRFPSQQGRSYFIKRLLRDVVFQEAQLAGFDWRLRRYRRRLQTGAYVSVLSVAGLVGLGWYTNYLHNQQYVRDVAARESLIREQISKLDSDGGTLEEVLPLLDSLRAIPGGYADTGVDAPWMSGLGLSQRDKLGSAANTAYRHALEKQLLPRVVMLMEQRLRSNRARPDDLYQTLRVYLMLGDSAHLDAGAVKRWVVRSWGEEMPHDVTGERRRMVEMHVDGLLAQLQLFPPVNLQRDLVDESRRIIARQPLANRLYAALVEEGVGEKIPDFSLIDAAGSEAIAVFAPPSTPLGRSVPGFYTFEGYKQVGQNGKHQLSEILKDDWVLGEAQGHLQRPDRIPDVTEGVRRLYLEDFGQQWEERLRDLRIVEFDEPRRGAELLRVLSGDRSPLRRLLEALERETDLARTGITQGGVAPEASEDTLDPWDWEDALRTTGEAGGAGTLLTPASAASTSPALRNLAELHQQVRRLGGNGAPIDATLEDLKELHAYLDALARAYDQGPAAIALVEGSGAAAISRVRMRASHQPSPLNRWLLGVANNAEQVGKKKQWGYLDSAWGSEVWSFWKRAIAGRYPFSRGSQQDAGLSDFSEFFGPSGRMDRFLIEKLDSYIEKEAKGWRWRVVSGEAYSRNTDVPRQLQRGGEIRDHFFRAGGNQPSVKFLLKPIELSENVRTFRLDIDGQVVEYDRVAKQAVGLRWPGPDGAGRVSFVFEDFDGFSHAGPGEEGPWAWFRFIDANARKFAKGSDRLIVSFSVGDYKARYELRADSALNPFTLEALHEFRCPERL